jgi:hypothetical protein
MHYLIEATYVSDYKIRVRFENNEMNLVDLEPHLDGPIFEPLKDIAYFSSFTVNPDIDTITWPNNADFSPEFLYEAGRQSKSIPIRQTIEEASAIDFAVYL